MTLGQDGLFLVFFQVGLDFTFEPWKPIYIFDGLVNLVLQLIIVEHRCLVAPKIKVGITARKVETSESPSLLFVRSWRQGIFIADPVGVIWG